MEYQENFIIWNEIIKLGLQVLIEKLDSSFIKSKKRNTLDYQIHHNS